MKEKTIEVYWIHKTSFGTSYQFMSIKKSEIFSED